MIVKARKEKEEVLVKVLNKYENVVFVEYQGKQYILDYYHDNFYSAYFDIEIKASEFVGGAL